MANGTRTRWLAPLLLAVVAVALCAALAAAASETAVQTWRLVNPEGAVFVKPVKIAPRINTLEGKTVGLKWNGKPNGNLFLDRIAELLAEQVKNVRIVKLYEIEPTTVPQSASAQDADRKAEIIARIRPDIVIGSQCD